MSWTPMGRPSFEVPSGMTSAGWPLALNGPTEGQRSNSDAAEDEQHIRTRKELSKSHSS
jgi:hypothetical protein